MPIKCTCKLCGGNFDTYPSEIKKGGGKFCCPEHYHTWISENKIRSGENSNLYKNAKVEVICKYCGTIKMEYKSQIKWRGSNFCNKSCRSKWISENKAGNNSWNWVDRIKCTCDVCGDTFDAFPSTIKRGHGKYCSQTCKGIAFKGKNNPNWNEGSSFLPYCPLWTSKFRDGVREYFGYLCVECQKSQVDNGEKLVVHHVNDNKKALCEEGDEVKDRLFVTLCRSCHGKTVPISRRKYYRERYTTLINDVYNGQCYNTQKSECGE